MQVIVVRHYKTASNASEHIIGWGDSPPIKEWRKDIDYVNRKLLNSQIHIDRIYTSELRRARNTGLFYANSHEIHKIHHCPEFNEVDYGTLNEKDKKWVSQTIPEHKIDPNYVYPKGESFRQMQQRSVEHIEKLAQQHPDESVLVVVHAGVIRGLICHFLGLEYANNLNRRIGHRYIGVFDFENGKCVRYDELGRHSGFIKDKIVKPPVVAA